MSDAIAVGSKWVQRHRGSLVVVNAVQSDHVQIIVKDGKFLRWLSLIGFLRYYEPKEETL